MTKRYQLSIPDAADAVLKRVAARRLMTVSQWVVQAALEADASPRRVSERGEFV